MKYLYIVLFTILSFSLFGQDAAKHDMIYMKDGSVFIGKLTAYEIKTIKFKMGDVLATISRNEISRIVMKGQTFETNTKSTLPDNTDYLRFGMYNITYGSFNTGADAFQGSVVSGIGITNITGKQFSKHLGLGLGISYNAMYVGAGENLMPIFIDARGYLKEKKVSPYYNIGFGYNFTFKNEEKQIIDTKGGIMFRPAIGFKIGTAEHSFLIDLGINFSQAKFTRDYNWETRENKMTYRRLELRVGLLL